MDEGIKLWEFLGRDGEKEMNLQLRHLKGILKQIERACKTAGSFEAADESDQFYDTRWGVNVFYKYLVSLGLSYARPVLIAGLAEEMPKIPPEIARGLIEKMLYPEDDLEEEVTDFMKGLARELFGVPQAEPNTRAP